MIEAEAFASIDMDLVAHLLALAQHLGEVAECFREVAARLLLDRDDDAEEVRFRERDTLVELRAGLADRHADRLGVDNCAELALERLGRVGRDDAQAVEERQAGLDAAHDNVDGIRKGRDEFVLAPLLEETQHPEWQAERPGKSHGERSNESGVEQRANPKSDRAEDGCGYEETLLRPS
jgi:hypothetical protein